MEEKAVKTERLRLDYPQTIKVGLAFAGIMVFWGAYDFVVPLLLENAYGMSNTLRGLIMGLDNLLSLFLLPLFGKLSDNSRGKLVDKFGRRTPFILIGTVCAVILMVFVPISAKGQMIRSDKIRDDYYLEMSRNPEALKARLTSFWDGEDSKKYCDKQYLKDNYKDKSETEIKNVYVNIKFNFLKREGFGKYTYSYNGEKISKERYDELRKENANYEKFAASGMKVWISEQVAENVTKTSAGRKSLALYMIILLFTLIAMAVYRSPAVALMPDVTPKPLRSQGNAIINLAGGVGSALAFIIYTVVFFGENINNFIIIFAAIAGTMLLLLGLYLWIVKEKKWSERCLEICKQYGISDEDEEDEEAEAEAGERKDDEISETSAKPADTPFTANPAEIVTDSVPPVKNGAFAFYRDKTKYEKAKFKSFLLILASIFMWFMGYNAVSSSLSIYCTKALNLPTSVASVVSGISMGFSAIAFIPVGFMAVKIGRRKSIMIGFIMAVAAYVLLFLFVRQSSNFLLPAVLFALFYLIAGFGLIVVNVNTFPMVVELASSGEVGKYTGYYYTATMSAQAITPMVAGLVMDHIGMKYLFLYSAICVVAATVLMVFVRHGDSKQLPTKKMTKEEKQRLILDSMGDAD